MGSRILANVNRNTKIAICCSFMIIAAAGSWGCPFASAAGIQTYSQYSSTGGIIQDNQYLTVQSSGDTGGFLTAGQERLTSVARNGLISTGTSGTKGNTTIDANDHQVYKGDIYTVYQDAGMTWDAVYMEGERAPIKAETTQIPTYDSTGNQTGSYNYTPGDTQENTTVSMRPYHESMSVSKETTGSRGTYMSDKIIEQGSNETTDYTILNAKAMGDGSFLNDVRVNSEIGLIGTQDSVNYDSQLKQHELTSGRYNATSFTTLESFTDVFGTAAISGDETSPSTQLGVA